MSTLLPLRATCLLMALAGLQACARKPETTTPTKVVEMDPLRIVAKHDDGGAYSFESYDAEELFRRGNAELDAGRCAEAVVLYDRVASEFVGNRYVSPALYNAGLCLAQTGAKEEGLERFETLISTLPESPDVKHASFQAGHLQIALQYWEPAERTAGQLLARSDLESGERVEAMSMQAEARLGEGNLDEAEHAAQQTLTYYRTRPADQVTDPFHAATANFVYAEVIRLRAERMAFPDTNQEEQKAILVKRAQLLLDAQREYFNTIRHTDAHWAAAAGHRIGGMYDKLWHDLVHAPVPASLSAGAKEMYPLEMAKLIKPLLRHAVRYWELTLLMVERTGVQTDWAEQTKKDLERVRALLLEQPPGPGGLPAQETVSPSSSAPAVPPASPASTTTSAVVGASGGDQPAAQTSR